jgi:hypothetical protein
LERNKNMALQSRNVFANAVGKKLILSETIKCFYGPIFKRGRGSFVPQFSTLGCEKVKLYTEVLHVLGVGTDHSQFCC